MEAIKKLMDRVNDSKLPLEKRYPELQVKDGKNILFVSPMLNKQGIYRMILPALELKEIGYNTIINQILPEDHKKTIDDYHVKLVPEIIRWADFIVFAANGQPNLQSIIDSIKGINPRVKIVMDVDRNYHALNPNNYTSKRFTVDKQRNLEQNLKLVDFSTYPDFSIEDFYRKKVSPNIKTFILPNLLSPFQFENIDKNIERPKEPSKYRVLLMADSDDFDDINSFRDTINNIMISVPQAKIYVLGNNFFYENKNPLRFINYIRVPYDNMIDYYKIIWNMNPDLAIIPMKKQTFYRSYYKVLELGVFGIPMVAMNEYPFNHLLKKDIHILLAGQKKTFINYVKYVLENPEVREKLSSYSKSFITEKYSFLNNEMISPYLRAFN